MLPTGALRQRLDEVALAMCGEFGGEIHGYLLDQALPDSPGWCVVCHRPCWLVVPMCLPCARAAGVAGPRLRHWPRWLRLLVRSRMNLVDRLRGHTRTDDQLADLVRDDTP